jgi:hypothetical protein
MYNKMAENSVCGCGFLNVFQLVAIPGTKTSNGARPPWRHFLLKILKIVFESFKKMIIMSKKLIQTLLYFRISKNDKCIDLDLVNNS